MSRSTIRTGVATYLTDASMVTAGLLKVRRGKPRQWPSSDWYSDTLRSTMAAFVYVESAIETVVATGSVAPHYGKKKIDYGIAVVWVFKSRENDADSAVDAYDALVDAIKARIRADRTLGGSAWQAGVTYLQEDSDEEQWDGNTQIIHGRLRFAATEWIDA